MQTYILLLNWTEQGLGKMKGSSKRVDASRKAFKKMGCELKEIYLTMGPYDLVSILEAPDAATAAKAILSISAAGNARTLTLPAFSEDEYRSITGSL